MIPAPASHNQTEEKMGAAKEAIDTYAGEAIDTYIGGGGESSKRRTKRCYPRRRNYVNMNAEKK
jgi:hypothetical protein